MDAQPTLVKHEPRMMLLMIGGGEDLMRLRERVVANRLAPFVRFTGHVGRPMLRALLGLAELTVDPVLDDAVARARSPLKILESLALGVPVVTGDTGDRRMLLADGEAGRLVRPGDPAALADGIAGLLADPASLRAKSEYALRHVPAHDWNRLAERFEMVYA